MSPDADQHQPNGAASLPPVFQQPLSAPTSVPSDPVSASPPAGEPVAAPAEQAKSLVSQYARDPYRLAEAFAQLKSSYLAAEHHISPNAAEN